MIIDGHDGDTNNDAFDALGFVTGALSPKDEDSGESGNKVAQLNSSARIKFLF